MQKQNQLKKITWFNLLNLSLERNNLMKRKKNYKDSFLTQSNIDGQNKN